MTEGQKLTFGGFVAAVLFFLAIAQVLSVMHRRIDDYIQRDSATQNEIIERITVLECRQGLREDDC